MTIVDELRREAEDALKETGMYYDVKYLSSIAKKVEAIVAENDKLRELVRVAHECKTDDGCCEDCWGDYGECPIEAEMKELGIEVGS